MTITGALGVVAGAALLAAAGAPALAHHSFQAEFDATKNVHIEGKVVQFQWVNPHSWLVVEVTDPATGEAARWRVEGGAPSPLLRRGWTRDSLPAGTQVVVDGFQARDGDTRMAGSDVTFPDGRKMNIGAPTTPGSEEGGGY